MYNIRTYGAKTDGTLCTAAIQAAIDECSRNGGGRVVIPSGTYVTGSIFLKSHVELHLEHGAVLKASDNLADYNADDAYEQNYFSQNEKWNAKHLIICVEQTDVALTGFGIIDGSGDKFYNFDKRIPCGGYAWRGGLLTSKDLENLRPGQLCCFIESNNIRVYDVTMTNATCWCCYLHGCEEVQIRGLRVKNPFDFVNTDGIDLDCCRNVTVSDCLISTGDDAIAIRGVEKRIKSPKICENITITNCCLESNSSAFRFGVGTGFIRHVSISNLVVSRSGSLFTFNTSYNNKGCVDIDDLRVNGVTAYNTGLLIECMISAGSVTRCSFRDIRADTLAGVILRSSDGAPIRDIVLDSVDLTVADSTHRRAEKYVIEAENANDVRFEDVRIFCDLEKEGWSGQFSAVGCDGVKVRDCSFNAD